MIQKSLKRLAQSSGATFMALFGKIHCTQKDYWVAQSVIKDQEESTKNKLQESRGTGVNKTVFWVTHNLLTDWV